jgi:hypothetical protein
VYANTKLNASLGRKANVSLNHAILHFDRTTNGVNNAPKLNDTPVASTFDYAPIMYGDCRINQITTECAQPGQCPVLVGPSEPAVSDYICSQDCYELPGLDHSTPRAAAILAQSPD